MKSLFFKRHLPFFATIAGFAVLIIFVGAKCVKLYRFKLERQADINERSKYLEKKQRELPPNHVKVEAEMQNDINSYKRFVLDNFSKMISMQHLDDPTMLPPNHMALFFEVRSYLSWTKNSCDMLGIDVDPTCSFGFQNFFNKNEKPSQREIYDRHMQKEQLKLLFTYLIEPKSPYLKILAMDRGDTDVSAYFEQDDMFDPDVEQLGDSGSHIYKIQFVGFTNTLRNFLKNLYNNRTPVIFREIDIAPNRIFRVNKAPQNQISECLASTVTITLEFLEIPESVYSSLRQNAALYRKLRYQAM